MAARRHSSRREGEVPCTPSRIPRPVPQIRKPPSRSLQRVKQPLPRLNQRGECIRPWLPVSCPFLNKLPRELRDMIYDCLFNNDRRFCIDINGEGEVFQAMRHLPPAPRLPSQTARGKCRLSSIASVLATCKQIHDEAIKRLWKTASFDIQVSSHENPARGPNWRMSIPMPMGLKSDVFQHIKRIDSLSIRIFLETRYHPHAVRAHLRQKAIDTMKELMQTTGMQVIKRELEIIMGDDVIRGEEDIGRWIQDLKGL